MIGVFGGAGLAHVRAVGGGHAVVCARRVSFSRGNMAFLHGALMGPRAAERMTMCARARELSFARREGMSQIRAEVMSISTRRPIQSLAMRARTGGKSTLAAGKSAGAGVGSRAGSTKSSSEVLLKAVVSDKALSAWLLTVSGAVFCMVVLGGVTRLTRSGLSMVDWRPQGSWLPSGDAEWAAEFEKYKQFPEYKLINSRMDLEEFKQIYFMEWLHRMWGRGLGVVFGVPLVYFVGSGRVQKLPGMTSRLLGLLALGGMQGLVGWWMVKSGLEEDPERNREPRVSSYRLTAHLVAALMLYSGLLWTGWTALHPERLSFASLSPAVQRLRSKGIYGVVLTGITFTSGAFVAGNDAGRAYNDWPLFAGNIIPNDIWDETLVPVYRNFFENTATVQFDHRNLAYLTAVFTLFSWSLARRPHIWAALPPPAQTSYKLMLAAMLAQVTLGISTLMMFVPVSLASAHQAGALTLWTTMLYSQHTLRYARKVVL